MIPLSDCVSFLAAKSYQRIQKRAKAALQPFGVTPTQYALLNVLWDLDGLNGSEIGERLMLDSAATTGLIDRAATAGLVKKVEDADDRRATRVWLTPSATALREPLNEAIGRLNEEIRSELGGDADGFLRSLKRLAIVT